MNNEVMQKPIVGLALLAVLAGCGSSGNPKPSDAATTPSAREATCIEVRAGIAAYNTQDLDAVQPRFVRAQVFAKKYAKESSSRKADELLEAVKFFADVPPSGYSKDAASSKLFEKYKAITLGDCVNGEQGGSTGDPGDQPA